MPLEVFIGLQLHQTYDWCEYEKKNDGRGRMTPDEGDEVGHVGVQSVPQCRLCQVIERANESLDAYCTQEIA